ncbi:MAG: hypothetical protein KF901_29210 [Myxococcales bacterium]|nr:hypothetical protein [Myxococcales bacterium]
MPILVAALVLGFVAPFLRAAAWGVPYSFFSRAMALRAFLGDVLVTAALGGILSLLAPTLVAAATGAACALVLAITSARRHRHLRGLTLLAYRLGQPDSRDEARAYLVARLAYLARRLPPREYAEYALFASLPLSAVEAWDDARVVLDAVDLDALEPNARSRALQARATLALQRGDLEAASEALAAIPRPAEPAVERWVQAGEALLLAVQGAADEALARCHEATDADGALAATYDVVRAHALACRGEEDEAQKALRRVHAIAGDGGLRRAISPVGPATDLARALLGSGGEAQS